MANKGLKEYTKQLSQSVGNAKIAVNVNKEDKNMIITLPLIKTTGLSVMEVGLIYNNLNNNDSGLFGTGSRITLFESLEIVSFEVIKMTNPDGTVDEYKKESGNPYTYYTYSNETSKLTIRANSYYDEETGDEGITGYEIRDNQGNYKYYKASNLTNPSYISFKNGDRINIDFDEDTKTISNGKGDVIELTGNPVSKLEYKYNGNTMFETLVEYNGLKVSTVIYKLNSMEVGKNTISYETNKITVCDNVSGYRIKYDFTLANEITIVDGYDAEFSLGTTTLVELEEKKSTITNNLNEKTYVYFDEDNIPILEIDKDDNAVSTLYDSKSKMVKRQSSTIPLKNKLDNLFIDVIEDIPTGIQKNELTSEEGIFNDYGFSFYELVGTGDLTLTLRKRFLATDNLSLVLLVKQLEAYTEEKFVKIRVIAGNETDTYVLDREVLISDYELIPLGLSLKSTVDYVNVVIMLRGGVRVKISEAELYLKDFGTMYAYNESKDVTNVTTGYGVKDYTYTEGFISSSFDESSILYDFSRNGKGQITSAKTAYGVMVNQEYENNKVKSKEISNGLGNKKLKQSQEFSSDGRKVTKVTDELGNQTSYSYDDFERIIRVTNALNEQMDYKYFETGNISLLEQMLLKKDNQQIGVTYTYESGLIKTLTLTNGSVYEYEYDDYKNIKEVKLNNKIICSYTYDKQLLKSIKYGEQGDTYTFDYTNNLLSVISLNGAIKYKYEYNDKNQLSKVLDDENKALEWYTYDIDGKVIKVETSVSTIKYGYDNLGQINQLAKDINDRRIYQSYETINRSKGSHPESLESMIQSNYGQFGTIFLEDASIKGLSGIINPVSSNIVLGKEGVIPYIDISASDNLRYQITKYNNTYPNGSVAFWFKPTAITEVVQYLLNLKDRNGSSSLNIFIEGTNIYSEVHDSNGLLHQLLTPNVEIKENEWNFLGFNWLYRNEENASCEFSLTINEVTDCYKLSGELIDFVVENNALFCIGNKYLSNSSSAYKFNGYITALSISNDKYMMFNEMNSYYKTSKDYLIENEYVDDSIKSVDFSQTNLYTSNDTIHSYFEIFPLNNHVKSLDNVEPISFDLRNVSNLDRDRTFNFNNKIGRYAYVADGTLLRYDTESFESGTIFMRAITEIDNNIETLLEIESNDILFRLNRNSNNKLEIQSNSTTTESSLVMTSNEWHKVGLSWQVSVSSDSLTTHSIEFRIYLDGQTYLIQFGMDELTASFILTLGRRKTGVSSTYYLGSTNEVYPLMGQIEMLCIGGAYFSTSTLSQLANEIDCVTKISEYDDLGMLQRNKIHKNNTTILANTLTYKQNPNDPNYISKLVSKEEIKTREDNITRNYTTDSLGRVTSITDPVFGNKTYQYDYRGYLINDNGTSITYDNNGNITSYGTTTYTYDSTVKDKLIAVGNNSITYLESNSFIPQSYNGNTFTFEGRRLTRIQNATTTCEFEYNHQGLRTSKKVGDNTAKYVYDQDRLVKEITLNNIPIDYLYDENNKLYGLIYNQTHKYYYIRDILQNILGLVDENGQLVVKYNYNGYGKPLGSNNGVTLDITTENIGTVNPFRYKGYYYDVETQLFYCNSRYYSPELCRFISPDSIEYLDPQSINGLNLYCYCMNNPIMYADPSGHSPTAWWEWALAGVAVAGLIVGSIFTCGTLAGAVLAGAAIGAGISLGTQAFSGELNWGQFALDTGVGAITGLIGGSGVSRGVATLLGGVVGAGSNFVSQLITGTELEDISVMQILAAGAIGAISGFIGGAGARNKAAINQGKGVQVATKQLNKVVRRIANGYRYNATTAQVAFTNAMNGLTSAISSQMGRMLATAMISYGVSTVAFAGIDAGFDYLGWWFF